MMKGGQSSSDALMQRVGIVSPVREIQGSLGWEKTGVGWIPEGQESI